MPTYDYQCDRCGRTYEVWQRISEPPLGSCRECGGPVRRLLAPAAFILKGSGWYVTDCPSEARKKGMEAEKKAAEGPVGAASGGDAKSSSAAASGSGASTTP